MEGGGAGTGLSVICAALSDGQGRGGVRGGYFPPKCYLEAHFSQFYAGRSLIFI